MDAIRLPPGLPIAGSFAALVTSGDRPRREQGTHNASAAGSNPAGPTTHPPPECGLTTDSARNPLGLTITAPGRADCGWFLLPRFHGRGHATQAVRQL